MGSQSLAMLNLFPRMRPPQKINRLVREEVIDRSKPWAYFDEEAESNVEKGDVGGLIYRSEDHYFKFVNGLGSSTNNVAELKALKFTLEESLSQNIQHLQIFGDFRLVIDWMR